MGVVRLGERPFKRSAEHLSLWERSDRQVRVRGY